MNGILTAIQNLAAVVPAFAGALSALAMISGLGFFILSLRNLAKLHNSNVRDTSVNLVVIQAVIGVCLLSLPSAVFLLQTALFGTDLNSNASSIFSYAPTTIGLFSSGQPRTIITSGVIIIQFLGLIAVIRGFFLLNAYGKQAIKSIGSPITFLIAGAIALNYPVFIGYLESLFTP